jgi:hypothetical protein
MGWGRPKDLYQPPQSYPLDTQPEAAFRQVPRIVNVALQNYRQWSMGSNGWGDPALPARHYSAYIPVLTWSPRPAR